MKTLYVGESSLYFNKAGVRTTVAYEKGFTILEFSSGMHALMVDTNWVEYASLIGDGHITLNNVYPTYTGATLKIVAAKRINTNDELFMNWRAFTELTSAPIKFPIDLSHIYDNSHQFIINFGAGRQHFDKEVVFTSMWEDVYANVVTLTGYKGLRTYPEVTSELIEAIVDKVDAKFFSNTFKGSFFIETSVVEVDPLGRTAYVTPVFDEGG